MLKERNYTLKALVIPDVHLKPWMFDAASAILKSTDAERAVCLMDIPDNWNQEANLDLYMETFESAVKFQEAYPDTLWCYGNHDLSYVWMQQESGFSFVAIQTVNEGLKNLRNILPDERQMTYIHRIDNVLFLHGGLTDPFVRYYASDVDYNDVDAVLERINSLGSEAMWDDASPIWYRPQVYIEKMYKQEELLQVVGHTPVEEITMDWNLLSCDVFSTYRDQSPIGTEEFLLIDTKSLEYKGVKCNTEERRFL